MLIRRANCMHNYNTTDKVYEIEDIVDIFGFAESRWFLVKYRGYEESEWAREHLLKRDGYQDKVRDYWARSGLNPRKIFYPDKSVKPRCTICN